ncbi:MAG: thioredoxin domain-containing protein [Campylobacteraceae bacterium]|jgi:protein-disulfide isomerase|nr:thioredoxin domain-containing protein [Campylobacteraceae bacterium]
MKTNYIIAAVLALILILFGAGAYAYNAYKQNQISQEVDSLLIRDYSYVLGNKNAEVTIVEFFDPMCYACVRISPIVVKLAEKYPTQVRVVYRALAYHENSNIVLSLLEAAREQGRFEEAMAAFNIYYKNWYANNQLNNFVAWGILEQVGVNTKRVKEFLDENQAKIDEQLKQNLEDSAKLGIRETPTLFVNKKLIKNNDLEKEVEALLKQ